MSFANLKKQSKLGSLTEKLVKEVEKLNTTGSSEDDRYWKLTTDKSQNGYAVIRFLPAPGEEEIPFVKLYSHAFQGNGGWLIDNCLTTLGKQCPVCEANRDLWNTGSKENKDIASNRKRKLTYISNIYVVEDPSNPENEGKVFLYKFGKKIFDKITAAMKPEFKDETPIDPFDLWKGANFKLKAKNVAGYRNYDSSAFAPPSPLLGNDDELEVIWKEEYPLAEIVADDQFKSYDDLKKRFTSVLGTKGARTQDPETASEEDEYDVERSTKSASSFSSSSRSASDDDDEDEDEALSYFSKLANS